MVSNVKTGALVYAWCQGTPCWKDREGNENLGNVSMNTALVMLQFEEEEMCYVLSPYGPAWVFSGNLSLTKGPKAQPLAFTPPF